MCYLLSQLFQLPISVCEWDWKAPKAPDQWTQERLFPFGAHLKAEDHKFPDDVKILETESRYLQRGINEAYYIASLEPDLNQNKGRYSLSPIYSSVIKSCHRGSSR